MLIRITVILIALASAALAQQPNISPIDQALSMKVLEEVNANIQLRAQLIEAQTKIKQLEEKKEPPKMSSTKEPEVR